MLGFVRFDIHFILNSILSGAITLQVIALQVLCSY